MSNPTCTVGPSAVTGERCGNPAVASFVGTDGATYYECAAHHTPTHMRFGGGDSIGDIVEVHRHGKTYAGQIVRVTRTGRRYASVTYGNGCERVVEV